MSETLSSLFLASKGAPIEKDGHLIYPIFQMNIPKDTNSFLIRRLRSASAPVSGLRIKVVRGEIEVNNKRYEDIILWADTSPSIVKIAVISKFGCELKAWNVWRFNDLTQAWVGNAGMLVNREDNLITLECSDGVGETDFSSLTVEIELI